MANGIGFDGSGDLDLFGSSITELAGLIPDGDGTRSIGLSGLVWGTVWCRRIQTDVGAGIRIANADGDEAFTAAPGSAVINGAGVDMDFRSEGDTDADLFTTDAGLDRAGVGVALGAHTGKFHVDQNETAGAIPVLVLDQGDDSEEMIEFIGTIGTGNALEAVGAKALTTTHFVKVTLPGGLTRYLPVGTIA